MTTNFFLLHELCMVGKYALRTEVKINLNKRRSHACKEKRFT